MTNISSETVQTQELHIIIGRRPNLSMVDGKPYVPMANTVFMTAARSWDKNGDNPMLAKMRVL
jgi:hypothetical protein